MKHETIRSLLTLLGEEIANESSAKPVKTLEQAAPDYGDLLDCAEAAKYLGLGRTTWWRLRKQIKDPLLAPLQPKPGVFRYSRHALARYLEKTGTDNLGRT